MLMHPYKEPNSDESTTADGGASEASLNDARRADIAREQPPVLRCQRLISSFMQVDCISVCLPSGSSADQIAHQSSTLMFVDWDDVLFPTTEIFERWRVPTDKVAWASYSFSQAQRSLLDAWCDALYQYMSALGTLSERLVVVTTSDSLHAYDCIDAFAPKLRTLLRCRDAPRIVSVHELDETVSEDDIEFGRCDLSPMLEAHAEAESDPKLATMRCESKVFFATRALRTLDAASMDDIASDLDAMSNSSFRRVGPIGEDARKQSFATPVAPSISQITARMVLSRESLPLVVQYNSETPHVSKEQDRFEAIIGVLDDYLEIVDHSPPRLLSCGRSRPPFEDFKHRRDLWEYRDEFVEILHDV